ncbi:MAG: helix-turn-helix transcriptional regulator [Rhodobacteraceae bacterium]|nr:helix-turn-helix transcriptional regulator [Paracoccaceae bacterium]
MHTTGDRIKDACRRNQITLAAACKKAGIAYKTLHAQISNNRPIPFETIDRLARYFDMPIEFFSAFRPTLAVQSRGDDSILHQRAAAAYTAALRSEQIEMMREGYNIGTDDVLNWLATQDGVLNNFDALRDRVDLFHPVGSDDNMMRPHRIGRESLATRFFKLESEEHYVKMVGGFDRKIIDKVMLAHLSANKLRYSITDQDIDVCVGGDRLFLSYRRIIAPVTDVNGREYMLVHAKLI